MRWKSPPILDHLPFFSNSVKIHRESTSNLENNGNSSVSQAIKRIESSLKDTAGKKISMTDEIDQILR